MNIQLHILIPRPRTCLKCQACAFIPSTASRASAKIISWSQVTIAAIQSLSTLNVLRPCVPVVSPPRWKPRRRDDILAIKRTGIRWPEILRTSDSFEKMIVSSACRTILGLLGHLPVVIPRKSLVSHGHSIPRVSSLPETIAAYVPGDAMSDARVRRLHMLRMTQTKVGDISEHFLFLLLISIFSFGVGRKFCSLRIAHGKYHYIIS